MRVNVQKIDVTKVRWAELNGSIVTEEHYEQLVEFKRVVKTQLFIAHNVGKSIAERIVNIHNDQLQYERPLS